MHEKGITQSKTLFAEAEKQNKTKQKQKKKQPKNKISGSVTPLLGSMCDDKMTWSADSPF